MCRKIPIFPRDYILEYDAMSIVDCIGIFVVEYDGINIIDALENLSRACCQVNFCHVKLSESNNPFSELTPFALNKSS